MFGPSRVRRRVPLQKEAEQNTTVNEDRVGRYMKEIIPESDLKLCIRNSIIPIIIDDWSHGSADRVAPL